MQSFDIIKESNISESFRVKSIMGMYDLSNDKIKERFRGSIDLSNDWNIGLIVGNSGTGKSSIARELFKENYISEYKYNADCLLDDFPKDIKVSELAELLTSVGFSSPPSWLKSYHVLSTGEKMRVNLARALCDDKELIVFDEFTSVVDRNIAKIGSYAIQKAIRGKQKKFIAVSCHFDIAEWLEPDWILNTNDMSFNVYQERLRRPKIELEIYKQKGDWGIFRKYHYLDSEINNSSHQYICYYENNSCAFIAVIHNPNVIKNLKRIHRIVVLPDYQGVGIGHSLLNFIAKKYTEMGFIISIISSHPSIKFMLKDDISWKLIGQGKNSKQSQIHNSDYYKRSLLRNKLNFRYIGDDSSVSVERDGQVIKYKDLMVYE